jgi:glycerol dehydrogenase-like iron-containing ADH family enzyme
MIVKGIPAVKKSLYRDRNKMRRVIDSIIAAKGGMLAKGSDRCRSAS